ncbi:metal ABC transporter ATP-binding protein [Gleimia hominis]|uniref:metal ABC transporter ATP-binding protein n=1 Tax=Gleimia hominis TaxID=595468 RepID=UPI0035E444E2
MPVNALEAHALDVGYDAGVILHGIDLTVPLGQCVAITGANGSGKSTLIRALFKSAQIRAGSLKLLGHEVTDSHVPWAQVGYVPQISSLSGGVISSALEVVRTGTLGKHQLWWPRGSKTRALTALDTVGLRSHQGVPVSQLSGGQRRRVLIARAIVRDPQVLIMDEPLAGIDAHSQQTLADLVGDLKARGCTIVTVLHELGPLAPHLDRCVNIASGHIDYDGQPRPSTPVHHHDSPHVPHTVMSNYQEGR